MFFIVVVFFIVDGPAETTAYEGDLFVSIVDVLPSVLAPLAACAGERMALNGNVSCHSVVVERRLSIPPIVSVNRFSRTAGC